MAEGPKKRRINSSQRYAGCDISAREMTKAMNGIVGIMTQRFGMHILDQVLWTEPSRMEVAFRELEVGTSTQPMHNHIPGVRFWFRKSNLFSRLNIFRKSNPEAYSFYPLSWNLQSKENSKHFFSNYDIKKTYIQKPSGGHQGAGILLAQGAGVLKWQRHCHAIVQEYVDRPLLLNGHKFDLRVYVLLESITPMRLCIFREGLVRVCTMAYNAPSANNIDKGYMHLTNFSLNKDSASFKAPPSPIKPGTWHTAQTTYEELLRLEHKDAHKKSISMLFTQLAAQGLDVDVVEFWEKVDDMVVKSLIAMWVPLLRAQETRLANIPARHTHVSRGDGLEGTTKSPSTHLDSKSARPAPPIRCFHMLGVDILMDEKLNLSLLEINSNPSMFSKRCSLDSVIKQGVMTSTMEIILPAAKPSSSPSSPTSSPSSSPSSGPSFQSSSAVEGKPEADSSNSAFMFARVPCSAHTTLVNRDFFRMPYLRVTPSEHSKYRAFMEQAGQRVPPWV